MRVTIEIKNGKGNDIVSKKDIQKNIDALQSCIDESQQLLILTSLMDTKSILIGIQEQLLN